MYIRVLCTIIYQSDDLALSASDTTELGLRGSGTLCRNLPTTRRFTVLVLGGCTNLLLFDPYSIGERCSTVALEGIQHGARSYELGYETLISSRNYDPNNAEPPTGRVATLLLQQVYN